jgi:hypothetical protein
MRLSSQHREHRSRPALTTRDDRFPSSNHPTWTLATRRPQSSASRSAGDSAGDKRRLHEPEFATAATIAITAAAPRGSRGHESWVPRRLALSTGWAQSLPALRIAECTAGGAACRIPICLCTRVWRGRPAYPAQPTRIALGSRPARATGAAGSLGQRSHSPESGAPSSPRLPGAPRGRAEGSASSSAVED